MPQRYRQVEAFAGPPAGPLRQGGEVGRVSTHKLVCPCGLDVEIDGWLDAVEIRALHNRAEGCDATVDLNYTREGK